jgi:hypothetical protein
MWLRPQQRRRFPGNQRHVEPIQGQRESFTPRLDVSFLAGPTEKERVPPQADRKPSERRNLALREKSLSELLYFQALADEFEVDTDLATTSNRIKSDSVRMGHVEMDRIPARVRGKGGLAVRAVAERKGIRRSFQINAEDLPERPASGDKALTIDLEVKPLRPRLLIF